MTLILREPDFIRQRKANSCWFACLQMLLQWHTGNGQINDRTVTDLTSHFTGRSYDDIPPAYRSTHNLRFVDQDFQSLDEVALALRTYGPFMGGGTVGKFFIGKRRFGHAILIYGITPSEHLLHHDPTLGRACKIKWSSYQQKQDGERMYYTANPRVDIVGIGN